MSQPIVVPLSLPHARRAALSRNAVAILGIGTSTPAHAPQTFAREFAIARCCDTPRQEDFLRRVYDHSGVLERGTVLADSAGDTPLEQQIAGFYPPRTAPDDRGPTTARRMLAYAQHAPELATQAATQALASAGVAASQITCLITVSCTGFFAPGMDAQLIQRLGLPRHVQRMQIGFMGCHGAFNALAQARHIALADPRDPRAPSARVLICCTELCSLHLAYGFDPQRIVANALFADGAAACVVAPADADALPDVLPLYHCLDTASLLIPDAPDSMTWIIGDHGFEMTLSPNLPETIRRHLPAWIGAFLNKHGLTIADIKRFAVHPGGPRILQAVEEALELEHESLQASRTILAKHGNMSSGTILFVLEELARTAGEGPCLAIGFGPGLMAEAMLLTS